MVMVMMHMMMVNNMMISMMMMIVMVMRAGLMVQWCSGVSQFLIMMMIMNVMMTMITMSCESHHFSLPFDFLYLFKFWSVILLLLIYLKKKGWTGANQINQVLNSEFSLIWRSSRPLTPDQLLCYSTSKAQSCPRGNLIFQFRKYISEIWKIQIILKLRVSCCASWNTGSKSAAAKLSLRCGNQQQRFSTSYLEANGSWIQPKQSHVTIYFSKINWKLRSICPKHFFFLQMRDILCQTKKFRQLTKLLPHFHRCIKVNSTGDMMSDQGQCCHALVGQQ